MLLVTFSDGGRSRIGILDRERNEVVDLQVAAYGLADTMSAFIAQGQTALMRAREALDSDKGRIDIEQISLQAPIPTPVRNIICIGKNYRTHVRELQSTGLGSAEIVDDAPDKPIFFTKATTSVIGPGEAIPASLDPTASADYEGELAVVIGQGGRGVTRAEAMQHVYGYTIINDVTSRRLQHDHQQWFLGKSLDGFCPLGPAILTADAVDDVGRLRIRTWVGDDLRQDDVIANLIFDIPCLIETLSRTMTLVAGDIISTGTPAGVGMGMKPPQYLQRGDVVKVEIEPIGTLNNPVT